MIPVNPSTAYDYNNEAQFRTQVVLEDKRNVKDNAPISSLVWTDVADGKAYRVTLDGGVFVFEELIP